MTGNKAQTSGNSPSVDPDEVAKFSALAQEWWEPAGKFRPLHRLNPTRLAFIRDGVAAHFERDPLGDRPLSGLSLLDIGCGGGVLCEPMSRLGARVTGIDASGTNIGVAAQHAGETGLEIDYQHAAAEDFAEAGAVFDIVLNMEVVEHVADVSAFLAASCALVKPGGVMVVATLNRTPKAFALAVVGAEYLLGWLPRGTHDWRRFVRPSELVRELEAGGLAAADITGVSYNPLADAWRLSRDTAVNYMVFAVKGGRIKPPDA